MQRTRWFTACKPLREQVGRFGPESAELVLKAKGRRCKVITGAQDCSMNFKSYSFPIPCNLHKCVFSLEILFDQFL